MVNGRSVSFLLFFRVTRSAKSDNLSAFHGSSKPGNRSFGRFSRPLLEVHFTSRFPHALKVKSLAVAEIFRYCKGFRLSYSFFCLLDQKYKRGVLHAILHQKIRFKNTTGQEYPVWHQYTIAEIAECLDRKRVPITSNERIRGIYPYYGANGIQDYVSGYIFDGEFVLLAEDGGHFNDFSVEPIAQYVSGRVWVNNHAHILRAKCNTRFLYYSLVHKDIRNYINNPSRGKLNQEDMQSIVIDIPCDEEQRRIVEFMEHIDHHIEVNSNELTHLLNIKKFLLQQLFI